MSKVSKEISVIVGKYTNSSGEQKNRYQRIGSVIETQNGPMLKIDVIPLKEGGWDGWAYLNDPKPKEYDQTFPATKMQARPMRQVSQVFEDDDLPF